MLGGMISTIPRPSLCPWQTPGTSFDSCTYPAAARHLYCDTSVSALAPDGFPLDCPLRKRQ